MRELLDAVLARHSWLKKYLPSFLRLPFQGGDGTNPLFDTRQLQKDEPSGGYIVVGIEDEA